MHNRAWCNEEITPGGCNGDTKSPGGPRHQRMMQVQALPRGLEV